ncbi:MAG: phage portal protein, partial [Parvularculaceae bacterium]|nr:phage portal protein [Parvularculaceae bacterium]
MKRLSNFLARRTAPEAKASRALVALSRPAGPVWTQRDYASLARAGYEKNVVVYRCVRLVAEAAASAPLRVVEGERPQAEHPLAALLMRPNAEQSGTELLEQSFGHLLTAGNAYFECVALDGAPRELYALRPDRMRARLDAGGWVEGWDYVVGGRTARFDARAESGPAPILQLKLFHPTNDHYGLSPLEAAAQSVDLHNAALAWNKALLDNAARPSGALVYQGPEGAESLSD